MGTTTRMSHDGELVVVALKRAANVYLVVTVLEKFLHVLGIIYQRSFLEGSTRTAPTDSRLIDGDNPNAQRFREFVIVVFEAATVTEAVREKDGFPLWVAVGFISKCSAVLEGVGVHCVLFEVAKASAAVMLT